MVEVRTLAPDIQVEMRYAGSNNFTGRPVPGYDADRCYLLAPVAEIFGGTVGGGLWDFAKAIGAPLALRDLGLTEADLDKAAGIATENPYWNPRPIDGASIRALLQQAWEGLRPSA